LTNLKGYGIMYVDIKSLKKYYIYNIHLTAKLRAQKVMNA